MNGWKIICKQTNAKIILHRSISGNKVELICKHLIETVGEGGLWRLLSSKKRLMDKYVQYQSKFCKIDNSLRV